MCYVDVNLGKRSWYKQMKWIKASEGTWNLKICGSENELRLLTCTLKNAKLFNIKKVGEFYQEMTNVRLWEWLSNDWDRYDWEFSTVFFPTLPYWIIITIERSNTIIQHICIGHFYNFVKFTNINTCRTLLIGTPKIWIATF